MGYNPTVAWFCRYLNLLNSHNSRLNALPSVSFCVLLRFNLEQPGENREFDELNELFKPRKTLRVTPHGRGVRGSLGLHQ